MSSSSSLLQLDFSAIPVRGRQAELQQLHQAWQKIVDEHDEPSSTGSSATTNAPKPPVQRQGRKKRRLPQVVLIQGPSGAGKSVLVDAFRETTQVRNDGTVTTQFDDAVWTRGKFDPSVSSSREPLLAVLGACVDQMIASLMSRSQTNTSNHWADIIQNDLRSECRVLARLSRRLSSMFDPKEVHTHPHHGCTELGEDDARSTSSHTSRLQEAFGLGGHSRSSRHTRGGFERLKLALRALVRRVTLEFPLVMVWDDLHWMDPASSQLLQYVLQDVEVQGRLLFVGTHRPVEQQADHVFWELSKSLDDAVVTRINLESLTVDACVNILKELVRRDAKDLLPLAQVIHHKTMGNAFSVVQFTRLLYDRKLLQYNMQRYRWEWELDRIQKETQISDSLVDLVIAKLETLPVPVQLILQMAALLGVNRFQVDNLDQGVQLCVFDDLDPEAYTPAAISKYVETAMEEGLLEKIPSNSNSQLAVDCEYMFSHDRIREGAYAMLPEGDTRSLMHLQVGRRLIESVKATDGACAVTDEVFLLAAYHLNIGQALLETQEEMLHAAKINLQASELAFEQSAFFSAANYLEHARAVTRDDWWKLHYQLMLKIATSLAYVKHCCGHNHGSSMMVEDVLLHARNLSDKTPVYRIKILILCQEGRHVQGIHTCIDVLDQHSVKIPRRRLKFRIARSVARTLWRLKKCTEEELDEFEYQNDRKFHDVIQWLQLLGQTAMQVARMEYQVIAALLIVKMVLDKKSLDELQYVAAVGGTAMAFWGDIPKAIFFESVFHKNVNESPPADGAIAGKLLLLFHVTNLHRPYSECTELSFRSLHESIEQCQIAYLFFAMFTYCNLYILSGLELAPLEKDTLRFVDMLREFRQAYFLELFLPTVQYVSNLVGKAVNPSVLTGDLMDEEEQLRLCAETKNIRAQGTILFCKMMLSFLFHEYDLANQLSDVLTPAYIEATVPWIPQRFFFQGLIALAMAKRTGHHRYRRKSTKFRKLLEKQLSRGNVNCTHYVWILQAAESTLGRNSDAIVRESFQKAISSAARTGFQQDRALANELAGQYFLDREDKHWATLYLRDAYEGYLGWGAQGKADHLFETYIDYMDPSLSSGSMARVPTSGMRARSRAAELKLDSRKELRISVVTSSSLKATDQSSTLSGQAL